MIGSRRLVWMTHGPKAGNFLEMDLDEADQAEAEGWAEVLRGVKLGVIAATKDDHPAAVAYLTGRGWYEDREMRSSRASAVAHSGEAPEPAAPGRAAAVKKKGR